MLSHRIWVLAIALSAPIAYGQASCPQGTKSHTDDKGTTWCMDSSGRSFKADDAPAADSTMEPNQPSMSQADIQKFIEEETYLPQHIVTRKLPGVISFHCSKGTTARVLQEFIAVCHDSSGRAFYPVPDQPPAADDAKMAKYRSFYGTQIPKAKLIAQSPSKGRNGNADPPKNGMGSAAIDILDATYGTECGGSFDNDGSCLKEACSGKRKCSYTFMSELAGGSSMSCIKSYIAHFKCGQGGYTKEFYTHPGMRHSKMTIMCGSNPDEEPVMKAKSDFEDTWPPLADLGFSPLEEFMYGSSVIPIPLTSRPDDLPQSFDFSCSSDTQRDITAVDAGAKGGAADRAGDYRSAACWYMNASLERNAEADFRLGMYFLHGTGVAEDYWTAIKFLRASADQGNVSGAAYLAESLDEGKNGVQYLRMAGYWNRRLIRSPEGQVAYREILKIRPQVRFPTRDLSKCNAFRPEDLMEVQKAADLSLYGWLEFNCLW